MAYRPDELRELSERLEAQIKGVGKLGYLARQYTMHPAAVDADVHCITEWMKDAAKALNVTANVIDEERNAAAHAAQR